MRRDADPAHTGEADADRVDPAKFEYRERFKIAFPQINDDLARGVEIARFAERFGNEFRFRRRGATVIVIIDPRVRAAQTVADQRRFCEFPWRPSLM
jgi:hypothetical protein